MSEAAFGEQLVREGCLSEEELRRALEHQEMVHTRLDTVLLDLGLLAEDELLEALGRHYETRTVTGSELVVAGVEVAHLVSPRMASRYEVVPFHLEGKTLSIATLNPGDVLVEDELALLTGCMVSTHVTLELRLYEALARLYGVVPPDQLVLVAKRLAGEPQGRVRRKAAEPAAPAPSSRPRPAPAAPAVPRRRAEPPVVASELELSAEELELFPSLQAHRAGEVEAPERVVVPAAAAPPALPPAPAPDASAEERLIAASFALQNAEMREDIADALLEYCAPELKRRMMLVNRKQVVVGWCGEGEGVEAAAVRAISIPLAEPSVFVGLTQGQSFWLGALPPMPRNLDLVLALGGEPPRDCLILPLTVRSRTVCFLYGDNLSEGVGGTPIAELRRVVAKAGLAFQVYLLKSKIRTI